MMKNTSEIKLNNMFVPNYPFTIAPTPRQIALGVSGVVLFVFLGYFVSCFSYINDSESSVTSLNITQGMLAFNASTASISGRLDLEVAVIGDPRVITTPNYADLSIEMNLNGTNGVTVASSGHIPFRLGKTPNLLFKLSCSDVPLSNQQKHKMKQMAETGMWVDVHGKFQTRERASSLPGPTRKSSARFHCKLAFSPVRGRSGGVLGVKLAYQFCWSNDDMVQLK